MFTKKNKVLFIIHDVYQDDNLLPLGPAYLAAVLHENGAQVEAYCMDIFHYTNEDLAKHLDENEYDLIGLGFMAARFEETIRELCKTINAHKKNAWFVLGGSGPSPIPEYMLKETKADIIAIGEFEKGIIKLLDAKIHNKPLKDIKSISYIENGELIVNERDAPISNIDEIPFPLWEIFPMEEYVNSIKFFKQDPGEKTFVFLSSRGCINRCNFCYRLERGIRVRSLQNIIEELKILYEKYGVTCYYFLDELFVLSKTRLREFEKALKEANLKIKFSCNARVDLIDEELIEILKRCGCTFINFGFESSDDNVLKIMEKNTTVEKNINALEVVKKVGGVGMGLNFIWNNFGDTAEILRNNANLIMKYNTYDQCRTIRPVTPYPGSPLYYTLIKQGKLGGAEDFFKKFKNSDLIFINNMSIPDAQAYKLLLEVNTDLVMDHYKHTSGNMEEAKKIIKDFTALYAGEIDNFRGARHLDKNG
ncbi:MAG: radical SAM protein [Candidatus Diapherotrites archaeon]